MKDTLFAVALCLGNLSLTDAAETSPYVFHVAPEGNDHWSGTPAEPNATQTDGPFATVARARDAIRRIRQRDEGLKKPVVVTIRGGTYFLAEPLVFTPADSGTPECPITYRAYQREKPILSGGRTVEGFTKGAGNLWSVEIPAVKSGQWYFYQLFVNGRRCTRARIPNRGYLRTERTLHERFYYRGDDIRRWTNFEDVSVVLMHLWEASVHFIDELDEQKRMARLNSRIPWGGFYPPWERHQRYYVANVREGLDAPGEWYLNRKSGRLSYYPRPGENMATAQVIASRLPVTLIELRGAPAQNQFVEHLHFEGLSLQHADADLSRSVINSGQAAAGQQAAVMGIGLRHSSFRRCEIAHVGEHAIWLRTGCQDNQIAECYLHDLGAGGVRIGEAGTAASEAETVERNTVDNNLIHHGARLFHGACGVCVGRSSYNRITHNDISDFGWIGIAVGWQWGYQPTTAHHNTIDFNHVHHIGHGIMSDMAAIYTLGVSPGTTVRNNLIHDVKAYPKYYNKELITGGGYAPQEASGIYPDEGTSGVLFENNVVYNVGGRCFGINYCRNNTLRNNIFAQSPHGLGLNIADAGHLQIDAQRNIICCTTPEILFGAWLGKQVMDNNLYWVTSGERPVFSGRTLAQWQAEGHDQHSIVADPGFVDPAAGDFRLRPDSPALKVGFKPIDIDAAGLYGNPEWVAMAENLTQREDDPDPPPRWPEPIDEDFEDSLAGEYPVRATQICRGSTRVHITNEMSAGNGRQCLKFIDVGGVPETFCPHISYQPNFKTGPVTFSCRVKNPSVTPATIQIEMRDWRQISYGVGPSLTLREDGQLLAAGRELAKIPLDQWITLQIAFELGQDTAETYTLTVTTPDQPPRTFTLPHTTPNFKILTWLGISSLNDAEATFYLDDIRLKQE